MKAVVCLAPGKIVLEDRPEPVRAPDEVLVRIRRVGICGTDYHIYEGLHPFLEYPRRDRARTGRDRGRSAGGQPVRGRRRMSSSCPTSAAATATPATAGKPNCCMRIAVLGVHRDGGMCEWLSLPEANLLPADGLSLDAAASVEFLAIGAHAVRRAG